jgi:PAS domain S-box-containing protein
MKNQAKTVLLVEDEALIAMNEAAMLKKHGYEVVTAYNAEQGVEIVRRKSPDLILMDIDLGKGKMDGTEAAEIILKEKEVPIVFLTSHAEKEYVDRVKNITGYGYVLKNSGDFVLIESITMAFHLFQAHQTEKANRLRLITIYNQALAGIAQVRADGTFIEANQKFCDIIGYTKKEVIEVSISDITAPEDLAAENVYIQEVLDGIKDSYSIEKRYIHKTGRPVWIQLESNVVRNLKGDPLYAIAVVIDIT